MDGGAWRATVHAVAKSQTRLSDLTFTFHFHALEKEMATHSSVLAWRIPGTREPGGISSMRSHRVGHDWNNLAAAAGVPEGEKRVEMVKNVFNNIMVEDIPSPKKKTDIQVQEAQMIQNKNQNRCTPQHIII